MKEEREKKKIAYVRFSRYSREFTSFSPDDIVRLNSFIGVDGWIPCYIDSECVSIIYGHHSVVDVSHFSVIVWGIRRIDCKAKTLKSKYVDNSNLASDRNVPARWIGTESSQV